MEQQDTNTKTKYFGSLNIWLEQLKSAQIMTNYMVLMNSSKAGDQNQRLCTHRPRTPHQPHQREIVRGVDILIAPFWKRILAQILDMLIMFGLKFMFFQTFDIDSVDGPLSLTFREDNPLTNLSNNFVGVDSQSSDLIANFLVTKFIVCLYESLWTTCFQGATLGKSLMSIRISYAEAIVLTPPVDRPRLFLQMRRDPISAIIYPCETPSMALVKNVLFSALYPISVLMLFLKNNRTTYDIITKTVVVETRQIEWIQH